MQKRSAFTLLELSIAVTVIGLLLATMSVIRNVKTNSEYKAFYKEMLTIREKMINFKAIYGYLPGDFPHAGKVFQGAFSGCTDAIINSGYGTSTRSGCNGNGDGNWDIALVSCCYGEGYMSWLHLQLAGLIGSPRGGDDYYFGYEAISDPSSHNNNLYQSDIITDSLFLPTKSWYDYRSHPSVRGPRLRIMSSNITQDEIVSNIGILTPTQLSKIDIKFDDGHPKLGLIEGVTFWGTAPAVADQCTTKDNYGSPAYVASDFEAAAYNLSSDERNCIIHYMIKE